MTWEEVKQKYKREVLRTMKAELRVGGSLSDEELESRVYQRIVDRACSTNAFFDQLAAVPQPPAAPAPPTKTDSSKDRGGKLGQTYSSLVRGLASSVGVFRTGHRLSSDAVPVPSEADRDICCDLGYGKETENEKQANASTNVLLLGVVPLSLPFLQPPSKPSVLSFSGIGRTHEAVTEQVPSWSQWLADLLTEQMAASSDSLSLDSLERVCSSSHHLLDISKLFFA